MPAQENITLDIEKKGNVFRQALNSEQVLDSQKMSTEMEKKMEELTRNSEKPSGELEKIIDKNKI